MRTTSGQHVDNVEKTRTCENNIEQRVDSEQEKLPICKSGASVQRSPSPPRMKWMYKVCRTRSGSQLVGARYEYQDSKTIPSLCQDSNILQHIQRFQDYLPIISINFISVQVSKNSNCSLECDSSVRRSSLIHVASHFPSIKYLSNQYIRLSFL
jgi:hypothetical protein